ncbi:unnamed protein product, partial [Ascophyllum nodosum]
LVCRHHDGVGAGVLCPCISLSFRLRSNRQPSGKIQVWRGCVHKRDRVVRLLYDSQDFYMGPFTSVCAVVYSGRCTTGLYF